MRLTPDEFKQWVVENTTFEYFRSGGKGGQHQNKTDSGCRARHLPSGIFAEGREFRSQPQNKQAALDRLIEKVRQHYVTSNDRERYASTEVVRTYREVDGLVIDHLSGETFTYREVVEKGNIEAPLQARRKATHLK